MKVTTLTRDRAIELFGSHIAADVNGSGFRQCLGSYEVAAADSQVGNEGKYLPWYFRDTQEGRMDANKYCADRRTNRAAKLRSEIEYMDQVKDGKLARIRAALSESFAESLGIYAARIDKKRREVDVLEGELPKFTPLPEIIEIGGEVLPVGTKLWTLTVDLKSKADPVQIIESEVTEIRVYNFDKPTVNMYFNRVVDDVVQDRTSVLKSEDVTDAEIRSNIIGQRKFRTKEQAVAAGKEYAKEIIAKLEKFAA